jgi:crotonobetainyl-CoA:carnitine CoA-transferase CaiB-like acyl-CoA transferase
MQNWASTYADAVVFEEKCSRSGLAVGVLRSVRELAESDWAEARGAVVRIDDRLGGTLRVPNSPWHFRGATTGVRGEPRYRGEDNRAVLGEVLGLDSARLDDLEARSIISSRLPRAK